MCWVHQTFLQRECMIDLLIPPTLARLILPCAPPRSSIMELSSSTRPPAAPPPTSPTLQACVKSVISLGREAAAPSARNEAALSHALMVGAPTCNPIEGESPLHHSPLAVCLLSLSLSLPISSPQLLIAGVQRAPCQRSGYPRDISAVSGRQP